MTLERHHDVTPDADPIHMFWVVGPEGSVSTWFSMRTKPILGYSVCDGASFHTWGPRPAAHWRLHSEPCALAPHGWPCWNSRGSMLHLTPIIGAYDTGRYDLVFEWLENLYDDEIRPLAPPRTT